MKAQGAKLDDAIAKVDQVVENQAAETDEERQAREAKEAEEAEAARKAEEHAKEPPANGGEDDQPGAGDDDFDENAELTPEQAAELERQAAEQMAAGL